MVFKWLNEEQANDDDENKDDIYDNFFISVPSINDYIMKQYNINIIFKFIHKYLRKIESNKKTPCIRCFFTLADRRDNNQGSLIFSQAYNTYSKSFDLMCLANFYLNLSCAEKDFASLRKDHPMPSSETNNPPVRALSF